MFDQWKGGTARACVVLACVFLAACTALPRKPEISLASVELAGISVREQRFLLKLEVRNPNDAEIALKSLRFDVELDGKAFARGTAAKPLVVPGQGQAVLEVNAAGNLLSVWQQLREARKAERARLPYRIFGVAEVEGVGELPFDRRGEIAALPSPGERKGASSPDRPL